MNGTCEWTPEFVVIESGKTFESECGLYYEFAQFTSIMDDCFKYCPKCGKEIIVTEPIYNEPN